MATVYRLDGNDASGGRVNTEVAFFRPGREDRDGASRLGRKHASGGVGQRLGGSCLGREGGRGRGGDGESVPA